MSAVIEVGFDYSALDEVCRDEVRDAAVRIKVRMARTAADIIDIGRDLIAVKKALGHGSFLRWIEAEFGMGTTTAENFINVAKRFGDKIPNVGNMGASVLYLLAAPSTPDDVVEDVTERAARGETFTAADIKAMKDEWAAEKKGLKQQVEDAKFKAKDAKASTDEFNQQLQSMRSELATLRDENDTLRHELEHKPASIPQGPSDAPLNDFEAKNKQVAALMAAWNKAGKEAREEFLSRVDTPVFDRGAA